MKRMSRKRSSSRSPRGSSSKSKRDRRDRSDSRDRKRHSRSRGQRRSRSTDRGQRSHSRDRDQRSRSTDGQRSKSREHYGSKSKRVRRSRSRGHDERFRSKEDGADGMKEGATAMSQGGILHPSAELRWTHRHKPLWRHGYFPRSCAVLQDKVAILTSHHHSSCDIFHVSSTRLDSWTSVPLPYQFMSLTTYQSRFVAVGGRVHNKPTNELLTSASGLVWKPSLPPMPTKRYMTSSVSGRSPEALVVAGGRDSQGRKMKVLEVLVGDKWTSVDLLPSPDCGMHSTFHDGKIFFMKDGRTKFTAYSCNLFSLVSLGIASSEETELLWEQLPAPGEKTTVGAIVSFSSHLVSINGEAIVRAYSNTAKSWVTTTSVGNKSKRHGYHIAASCYSMSEIVFVHKRGGIYLLQLSISPFSLVSNFTPDILTRLEASGVEVATLLEEFHSTRDSSLDLQEVEKMLLYWSDGLLGDRPPCWRELLMVLKNVRLSKLFTKLLDWLQQQRDKPRRDAGGHVSHKTDLLHPLVSLTWKFCCEPPWKRRGYFTTHVVALQDTVAMLTSGLAGAPDILFLSSTNLHSWAGISLPYKDMSLTIYQSKFVLVGGRHPSTHEPTNIVLTSTTGQQWESSLPAMPTKRYATSSVSTTSPEVLVVAGGEGSDEEVLNIIEMLMIDQWITIDPLPAPDCGMDSTVHEGNLYFMTHGDNRNTITTCSCTSLISSCTDSSRMSSTDSPLWSQFQAPGGHRSIISCSSQLVIIDNEGTARGYSSTIQSWVEASMAGSMAGDRPYEGYHGSAATVLPTGEILHCHEAGVFRGTVSESSYSPEIEFPRNVLTRLEAVMGVQIVSVLAELHSTLTSSSGVELQPRVNRYGHDIALPDPDKEPAQYVVEVVLQWSAGRSRHYPTWRQLLTVLQDIGLVQLSQQIQEFIKGEFKFTSAYRHFIKTKDVITMRFLKFLFSGPPRVGKTTALRRLIGEIIDLLSAGEAKLVHSSTGAVESKRDMIVRTPSITTSLVTDAEWCAVNSHVDEACLLFQMLRQSLEIPSYSTPAIGKMGIQSLETKHVPSTSTLATGKMDTRIMDTATTTTFTTATAQEQPIKRDTSGGKPKPTLPKLRLSTPPNDIPVVVELFKKASAQPKFAESMQHVFKAYLRIEDTGGQPELMDMLPALAITPGLYLLFFNLKWNLKKEFKTYYQHSPGRATTPEESKITLEEMLLSTLSSISCSCAPANSLKGEEANNSEMHDILESSKSVAYFVGTHKDSVTDEQISQFDKDLQSIIKGTDFFEKDLVQFCSQDKLIVAMNNMDGDVEEVEAIKKMLNQAMERHFKPLSIPAVWLLLNLCLRMNKARTASMKSVLELSSQFNMSAYETKVALWFLHHHAGVVMYFPDVPLLEDLVILDTQVVYDSVTFLILRAMNFDNVGHASSKKFRETGQFVLKDLVAAMDRVSGGDLIPPKKLIALLKFLHIIALISRGPYTHSSAEDQDVVYLMPCVLPTASKHQLDTIFNDPGRPLHVAPLLVRYKCGFVPLGIFPALVANLIPNKSFRLVQRGMMKNKVQFYHQPLKTLVSFLCYPRFYVIVISQLFVSECEVHKECAAIRQQVVAALEQVDSRMNYGNFVDYQFAFECPSHPGREHLCVVEEYSEVTKLMECLEYVDCRQPEKMGSAHTVWWGESKPESPVSVAAIIKQASSTKDSDPDFRLGTIMRLFHGDFRDSAAEELGTYLDIPNTIIQEFREYNKGNPKGLLIDVLDYWIETDPENSWSKLAEAVEDCGYGVLAEKIRQKFSDFSILGLGAT